MRRRQAHHVEFDFDEREARRAKLRELRQRFGKEIGRIADEGIPRDFPEDRDVGRQPGENDEDPAIARPVPSSTRVLSPPRDGSPRAPRPADIKRAECPPISELVRREVKAGDVVEAFRAGGIRWRIRVEAVVHDEIVGVLLRSSDAADVVDRLVVVPARMVTVRRGRVLTFPAGT